MYTDRPVNLSQEWAQKPGRAFLSLPPSSPPLFHGGKKVKISSFLPPSLPPSSSLQAGSLLLLGNELSETREMVFVAVMLVAFEKINADFTTTALELFGCAHCSGMTGEGDYHGTREM